MLKNQKRICSGTCQPVTHRNTKKKEISEEWFLHRPPSLYNGVVALFLDLDFNFGILVCYFEYPGFFGIDQPLQGQHISPVHAFEIVTLIEDFTHFFHSLSDMMDNRPEHLSILCDFMF